MTSLYFGNKTVQQELQLALNDRRLTTKYVSVRNKVQLSIIHMNGPASSETRMHARLEKAKKSLESPGYGEPPTDRRDTVVFNELTDEDQPLLHQRCGGFL